MERITSKARVVGSSPTRGTLLRKDALYSISNFIPTKIPYVEYLIFL
jgi:hypothetical protein